MSPPKGTKSQEDEWASLHRSERNFALAVASVLGLLTLYFAGLNAWVLIEAAPAPYVLAFVSHPGAQGAVYSATVEWKELENRPSAVRPQLYLGETGIPDGATLAEHPATVRLADRSLIRVEVPSNASPGVHLGELVLRRSTGGSELPDRLSAPISIGVTSGFWSSWFVLRYWLFFLVALGSLFYALCTVVFPAPFGFLVFQVPPRRLPLRINPRAWWLPWRRSNLRLRSIWRKAALPVPPGLDGELVFIATGLPPLLLRRGGRRGLSKRLVATQTDSLPTPCGPVELLYEQWQFEFVDTSKGRVCFSFERRSKRTSLA